MAFIGLFLRWWWEVSVLSEGYAPLLDTLVTVVLLTSEVILQLAKGLLLYFTRHSGGGGAVVTHAAPTHGVDNLSVYLSSHELASSSFPFLLRCGSHSKEWPCKMLYL